MPPPAGALSFFSLISVMAQSVVRSSPEIDAAFCSATRSTFVWTAVYQMGANPVDELRAWNLMQFFGGKASDGKYHVATRWALDFGLGTPHKEVIESAEVQEAFSQWKDMEVATQQLEASLQSPRQIGRI